MNEVQKTFKRYEKKYMLAKSEYDLLKSKLNEYMIKDNFGVYSICNIYFDTDTYEIIRQSIEKPIYKEKLRLRSYGTPDKQDEVFFELKKKYKKEVFKRRITLTMKELEDYIYKGIKPNKSEQILSEIDYFISRYNPKPKIYIAYDREAFCGIDNDSLRITFDKNIRFRNDNLSLCAGDKGKKILNNNQYLMEIKIPGAMPMWLSKILSEMDIYPHSFSKYGYCYKNYLNCKNA